MSDPLSASPAGKTEARVFTVVFSCLLIFAAWTLACHLAVVLGVSWVRLKYGFLAALPAIIFVAFRIARSGAGAYADQLPHRRFANWGLNGSRACLALSAAFVGLLALFPGFSTRYLITALFFLAAFALRRRVLFQRAQPSSILVPSPASVGRSGSRFTVPILIGLAVLAAALAIAAHRPDADDANFLQIARATQLNPNLPVFSFDTSLGGNIGRFRFGPYLLSSYELLTAWVDDVTTSGLFRTYYVFFPAASAVLCVLMAFLFSRWFLPVRSSILAVGLFLVISFAWGETHLAYGNRLFVRLFQGKGLLIAITIPALTLAGIVGMRVPKISQRLIFFGSAIACVGVSSSGLIIAPIAGMIAVFSGIVTFDRRTLQNAVWLLGTLAYLLMAGLLLKFCAKSIVPYAEIGTVAGIEVSLGSGLHAVLVLGVCGIGALSLRPSGNHRVLFLLIAANLLIIFNPYLAPAIASISAGNATWRLAWASPMPLLLAIVFAGLLSAIPLRKPFVTQVIALGALAVFLSTNSWVFREKNDVRLAMPGPTITPDYFLTVELMKAAHRLAPDPVVLAENRIAAWVPLAAPGTDLVMAGHTFPSMLRTVLTPADFARRMALFSMADGNLLATDDSSARAAALFADFGVNILIIKTDSLARNPLLRALAAYRRTPKDTVRIGEFSLLHF